MARGASLNSRYRAQFHRGAGLSAGLLKQRGMPNFNAYLKADYIEAIRSYLIAMGQATLPGLEPQNHHNVHTNKKGRPVGRPWL